MITAIWFVGIYLLLGVLMTMMLSTTPPYGQTMWIITALLWPFFLFP